MTTSETPTTNKKKKEKIEVEVKENCFTIHFRAGAVINNEYYTSMAKQREDFQNQEYMKNPLLINSRKFDIRVFALLTSVNGNV